MKLLSTRRHRIAAAVTAATITLGGGAAAIAAVTAPAPAGALTMAARTSGVLSAATTPAAHGRGRHHRSLIARSDHATVELKVKGQWVTFDLDRGKVTSVSATAITLARPDGRSVTLAIDSATRWGRVTSAGSVKTGREATVISENGAARRVIQALHPRAAATGSAATTSA